MMTQTDCNQRKKKKNNANNKKNFLKKVLNSRACIQIMNMKSVLLTFMW